jgi:MFS family permease
MGFASPMARLPTRLPARRAPETGEELPPALRPRSGAFSSLANANFRLLFSGTLASSFAMWMEQIGQGWLVHQVTGSPFQLGLVQFIRGCCILFVSPFIGAVAERVDRKKLAALATAANGLNALTVGILVSAGVIEVWQLYLTAFVGGLASSVYNPVRQHLVYSSVGPEHLANAIALNAGANNMSRVVAPNVSGAVIGYFGVQSSFFAESLFFGSATLTLIQLRLHPVERPVTESVLQSVRLGVSYLRRHPVLSRIVLLQAVPTLMVYPYLQLMPSMAADYLGLGPRGFGFLQTGVGVGSIAMTLAVARFSDVRRKGRIMSIALMFYMSMILAFSFSRLVALSFALLVLGGMNLIVFNTFNQTLLQLHVDDGYRSRVLSLFTMVQGLNPFGSLMMGSLAEAIGTPHAIASMSAAAVVVAFFAGVGSRRVRSL